METDLTLGRPLKSRKKGNFRFYLALRFSVILFICKRTNINLESQLIMTLSNVVLTSLSLLPQLPIVSLASRR